MEEQLSFDDVMWRPCPHALQRAMKVVANIRASGGATNYTEAHLAARWHLRFFDPMPVACRGNCGRTDHDVRRFHAALNWETAPPERLRVDYAGRVFSIAPELDYIPLCPGCHRRFDSWRKALPQGIALAEAS